MNWIDDKYRDQLKERKFPKELREKGWSRMEKKLNADMPSGKAWKKLWLGLSTGVVVIAGVLSWWWLSGGFENEQQPVDRDSPAKITDVEEVTEHPHNEPESEEISIEKISSETVEPEKKEIPKDRVAAGVEKIKNESISEPESGVSPVQVKEEVSFAGLFEGKEILDINKFDLEAEDYPLQEEIADTEEQAELPEENTSGIENLFKGKKILDTEGFDLSVPTEKFLPEGESENEKSLAGEKNRREETGSDNDGDIEVPDIVETSVLAREVLPTEAPTEEVSSGEDLKIRYRHLSFPDLSDLPEKKDLKFFSRERFSVSLGVAYTHVGKWVESPDPGYKEFRKNEQGIRTFSSGVNIDYFSNRNWTFGIGVHSVEYGEVLDHTFKLRDTVTYDGRRGPPAGLHEIVHRDSVRIIDSINLGHWNYTVVHQYEDTSLSKYNGRVTWQYIEIPVTVGYRFGKGRLRPWLRTGIALGIPVRASYRFVNPELDGFTEIDNVEQAPLQYNYLLNLGVDCYVTRRFSIRLNALGSMQLRSGIDVYDIRQKYYRLGGSLEIAYNF